MILLRQLTRIFSLLSLLIFLTITSAATAEASSKINELQYVKTYNTESDGKSIYRVEIGIKGESPDYAVKIPAPVSSTLLIDIDETVPGKLNRRNNNAIDLSSNETISVKEIKINYTRLQLRIPIVIDENSYKVYTEQANRKEKKPFRLIIDIDKSMSYENYDDVYMLDGEGYDFNKIKSGSIVIDPGHGGSDSGAVGPNGVTEKSVSLAVALKVQNLLTQSGASVIMTRQTDRDVAWAEATNGQELQARVDKTPPNAALFVSIHCNAFSNPATHGMETYYYHGSVEGQRLATLLNEELENFGGLANRGVKPANFYVLKHSLVPASLVELAFVTNPEEESLLADESYQEQLALAITRAIKRYLGMSPDANFQNDR